MVTGPVLRILRVILLDYFLNSVKQLISPISQMRKSVPREEQTLPTAKELDSVEPEL